ncbi:MAG: putative sugar nucleotidyl transferase, partial [Polaribacter sp.]|nr:putative sugar nucleotidyl transferase [Polaribacter sp.]
MNIILFDSNRENYYPLTYTRPISDFRIGILTIKEKWAMYYKSVSVQTVDYLSAKFPLKIQKDNLWINSKVLPCSALITELKSLRVGELLKKDGEIIAARSAVFDLQKMNRIDSHVTFNAVENLWDIFSDNYREIESDFLLLTKRRKSQALNETNILVGDKIFIEKGAKVS